MTQAVAESGDEDGERIVKDASGNVLQSGDSVTLIKDLKVKGSSITLKQGTKIKGIRSSMVTTKSIARPMPARCWACYLRKA